MNFWLKGNVTIPPRPHTVGGLIGWARHVNRALIELRDRKIEGKVARPKSGTIKPPLLVTLQRVAEDPTTYEVYAEFGHVVPRHNASTDTGEPIEITSLPTPDAPLAVIEDDKLWVELTIDVDGKCTAADFDSGTTWPEDAPPELIGGDDQSGTEGQRYIRIAEIIADPESTATPPPLIREQLHTGHIDHFQPTLSENTSASPGDSEARLLKEWNPSAGRFDFRFLKAICGIKVTENTDEIEIKPDGNSFRVRLWHTTISGTTDAYGYGEVIVDAGVSPAQEFWVLNGIWYLTEPPNWGTCGGSSEPVYDVTWAIPTVGGPA